MQFIENRLFDEISPGDSAELSHTLSVEDISAYATMIGEVNPAHIDEAFAQSVSFQNSAAQSLWASGLIATLLATELPGPGTTCRSQALRFGSLPAPGDTVTVRIAVTAKHPEDNLLTLACTCRDQSGALVVEGEIEAIAPAQKIRRPRAVPANAPLHQPGAQYRNLISATHALAPLRTAVAHPCDALSLGGALEAASQGLIVPILVGPRAKIDAAARETGRSLEGVEIVDAPHSHAAAQLAVDLVRSGKADALMKGKLHTDELMAPIVDREKGLRTERRMSHVFMLDVPHYPKPLFITDAAINIFPDLETKRDIVQNAIELAEALGIAKPKVAILSAVETVYPKIPSTLDAAALCKMWDRGQIVGGMLDGPLAFDNAVSKEAAEAKGIISDVAGDADILVVPDIEAGNMAAKQLIHLAGAESAGIVLGARAPIILTSRADGIISRLASAAMAQLLFHHRPKSP
jgi:phosphate acetyltransferase